MITIKNIDRVDVIFQNILSVDKSRSPLPLFPVSSFPIALSSNAINCIGFCQVGKNRAEHEHSLHLVSSKQGSVVWH